MSTYPQRIICLTEETTETLYLLGCQDRIVGISGFTVRPMEARLEKPKVSTFLDANYEKIIALKPDIVFAFSDLQAEIAKELMLRGIQVVGFNQRSIQDILRMILTVGGIVGKQTEAQETVHKFEQRLEHISRQHNGSSRPRVYFEEWGDPLISGIRWVSELIEIAGGEDIFSELREHHNAKNRIVQPDEVLKRKPEIIIGSWCGRPFKKDQVKRRQGWELLPAIQNGRLYEVKSSIILQPGPAALTDGLDELVRIIQGS
ncbi:MAG: cobalamin-binding protein [Ignavibacteriae bacterium]|nr:cobalamin-binding protein [Ignavibacteriota bacterium]